MEAETWCGFVSCPHPTCWQAQRRTLRGVPQKATIKKEAKCIDLQPIKSEGNGQISKINNILETVFDDLAQYGTGMVQIKPASRGISLVDYLQSKVRRASAPLSNRCSTTNIESMHLSQSYPSADDMAWSGDNEQPIPSAVPITSSRTANLTPLTPVVIPGSVSHQRAGVSTANSHPISSREDLNRLYSSSALNSSATSIDGLAGSNRVPSTNTRHPAVAEVQTSSSSTTNATENSVNRLGNSSINVPNSFLNLTTNRQFYVWQPSANNGKRVEKPDVSNSIGNSYKKSQLIDGSVPLLPVPTRDILNEVNLPKQPDKEPTTSNQTCTYRPKGMLTSRTTRGRGRHSAPANQSSHESSVDLVGLPAKLLSDVLDNIEQGTLFSREQLNSFIRLSGFDLSSMASPCLEAEHVMAGLTQRKAKLHRPKDKNVRQPELHQTTKVFQLDGTLGPLKLETEVPTTIVPDGSPSPTSQLPAVSPIHPTGKIPVSNSTLGPQLSLSISLPHNSAPIRTAAGPQGVSLRSSALQPGSNYKSVAYNNIELTLAPIQTTPRGILISDSLSTHKDMSHSFDPRNNGPTEKSNSAHLKKAVKTGSQSSTPSNLNTKEPVRITTINTLGFPKRDQDFCSAGSEVIIRKGEVTIVPPACPPYIDKSAQFQNRHPEAGYISQQHKRSMHNKMTSSAHPEHVYSPTTTDVTSSTRRLVKSYSRERSFDEDRLWNGSYLAQIPNDYPRHQWNDEDKDYKFINHDVYNTTVEGNDDVPLPPPPSPEVTHTSHGVTRKIYGYPSRTS